MTRIALIATGIASTLHNVLELRQRLDDRGHDATILAPARAAEMLHANTPDPVLLRAPDDAAALVRAPLASLRARRYRAAAAGLVGLPLTTRRVRRETAEAAELIAAVRGLAPDLLVIDGEAHVAIIATSALGIPTALTLSFFCVTRHPGVPPLNTGLGPGEHEAIEQAWDDVVAGTARARRRRHFSRKAVRDLLGPIPYSTTSRTALGAVARRSGFDLKGRTDSRQWLRPHLYPDLPTLSMNLRELDFDHEPPPNWHYVGPMVHRRRVDAAVRADEHERWRRFRAGDRRDGGRPLVYCSLGSYWSADVDFLRRVVDVFRRRGDWDLVMGLGGRLDPAALGPMPGNVLVLAWAPQIEVLDAASAAIVHGGNGSLNECVVAGVPMVVYSTGHLDQDGVAARVAHHGIGIVGDRATDTSEAIEGHLETVLGDRALRHHVESLRSIAADPAVANRAVELLEALAAGGSRA